MGLGPDGAAAARGTDVVVGRSLCLLFTAAVGLPRALISPSPEELACPGPLEAETLVVMGRMTSSSADPFDKEVAGVMAFVPLGT